MILFNESRWKYKQSWTICRQFFLLIGMNGQNCPAKITYREAKLSGKFVPCTRVLSLEVMYLMYYEQGLIVIILDLGIKSNSKGVLKHDLITRVWSKNSLLSVSEVEGFSPKLPCFL